MQAVYAHLSCRNGVFLGMLCARLIVKMEWLTQTGFPISCCLPAQPTPSSSLMSARFNRATCGVLSMAWKEHVHARRCQSEPRVSGPVFFNVNLQRDGACGPGRAFGPQAGITSRVLSPSTGDDVRKITQ